jgi:hypothetical protein
MSTSEVTKQIKHLPVDEQKTFFLYLRKHLPEAERGQDSEPPISEEFKRTADEVFTKNAELFRKLAN